MAKPIEIVVLMLLLRSPNQDYILDNLSVLERVALLFVTTEIKIGVRYDRAFAMTQSIQRQESLIDFDLTPQEAGSVLQALECDQWGLSTTKRKSIVAVLRRLEAAIASHESESHIYTSNVSLEHILPQKPAQKSSWRDSWRDSDREVWTHLIGNLCILNGKKNASASNLDFADKQAKYSKTIFPLTKDITKLDQWTPNECEARHAKLLDQCRKIFSIT
jgi:hypothetical protein